MRRSEYRALTGTEAGRNLRGFFGDACNPNLSSRSLSDLRSALEGLGVYDEQAQNTLIHRYRELNRHAIDRSVTPFMLRQSSDAVAVGTLIELEKVDDIHGESRTEAAGKAEDETRAQSDQVVAAIEPETDGHRIAQDIDNQAKGVRFDNRGRAVVRI